MKSMEYRVTKNHCEKHCGESLLGLFHPWKAPRMRRGLAILLFMMIIIVMILVSRKLYWQPIVLLVMVGVWLIPYAYQKRQQEYKEEIAQKMDSLVNDPELLWLNFLNSEKEIKDLEIDWKRDDKPRISETNIQVLAFLKKEGTSQGLHRAISGFQDSGSAKKHLKRLVAKGLVESVGNDYQYIPWNFMIIDDFNKEVRGEEAEKLKKILNEGWEKMIDEGGGLSSNG